MIKFLYQLFILILILINNISFAKEEILFSVNNNVITTIDLTQRVNYLSILNNFDVNKIDKNNYIDDLISIKIFDEFVTIEELIITNQEILSLYNELFAGREKEIEQLNHINELSKEILVKVRSTGKLIKSTIELDKNIAFVNLLEEEHGISPGQACVFYSKNINGYKVLGGGWITKN